MYDLSVRKREQTDMREWLRGGASPCQGEGRGFESRLALIFFAKQAAFQGWSCKWSRRQVDGTG